MYWYLELYSSSLVPFCFPGDIFQIPPKIVLYSPTNKLLIVISSFLMENTHAHNTPIPRDRKITTHVQPVQQNGSSGLIVLKNTYTMWLMFVTMTFSSWTLGEMLIPFYFQFHPLRLLVRSQRWMRLESLLPLVDRNWLPV